MICRKHVRWLWAGIALISLLAIPFAVAKDRDKDDHKNHPAQNSGPKLGGSQPGGNPGGHQQGHARDNKPVISNPNPGHTPNPGVIRNVNQPPPIKRGGNDNKPGGNPIPGLGQPNAGNPPGGVRRNNNNNQPIINNPNLGNNSILNSPYLGNNNPILKIQQRNPELKNHLQQFPVDNAKRQQNEQNLLRNKDHVQQHLNNNPALQQKVQGPDGKVDFSKLHLEHNHGDRIATPIHKNGNLPLKVDNHPDLAHHFDQLNHAHNLHDFNQQMQHFQDPAFIKQHPDLARVDWNHVSGQFQNHIVDHHYRPLVASNVGTQLNLNRQFNLYQHGDVARQMNLNIALVNHGGWPHRYVGPIYGGFTTGAFSFWYAGPGFYPRHCWCPTWSPWVDWCWWNTCPPYYDPRPFVCRPVFYRPCPVWVVWRYPVWQPLPVVTSGTWVDLPTAVVTDGVDLQLVAVRFVDGGHPEQNLGTRYRVWFQNNSRIAEPQPFNVLLMASNAPDSTIDLPQAGVTIPSMNAGEMQSVDIRLPYSANKMQRVDDHLTPFNYLHVLVDSHRELNDLNPNNNGAVLARTDIMPVDPAAFAPDVSAAAPGAMVSIAGEGFGPEPGRVIVSVNGTQSEPTIYGWYDLGVQFELPNVPVSEPVNADVLIVRGDGASSNPVTVRLATADRLQEAALPPALEP